MSGRPGRARGGRGGRALLALAAALAAGPGAARAQSVGVAPITDEVAVPRDAAVRAAVAAAVTRAAMELLPEDFTPPGAAVGPDDDALDPSSWVEQRLGDDPFAYATRFRILEDRGRRPAMFSADPEVEYEYVVVADVDLDREAIRARLEALGLLDPGSGPSARQLRLVVEGLSSYRPLALLRRALAAERGVRSVLPIEFGDGRAVLAVDADRSAAALVADLSRHAPEGLRIVTVEEGPGAATLRVDWTPPEAEVEAADGLERPAAD